MIEIPVARRRTYLRTCRILALVSILTAANYLRWLLFGARPSTQWLYWMLVAAESFNIAQAAGFYYTISTQEWTEPPTPDFRMSLETVDVLVTVMGEPLEIIERTVSAALGMRHPRKFVRVLDDGRSPEVARLAQRLGADYVTRSDNIGAKAGNINHALATSTGTYVAIFDADQAPHADFLEATLGGFEDLAIAFVQTPQVYRNRGTNRVAAGAHNQQALFYGPIMRGKNGASATYSCGTNVVFRRSAIDAIGGIPEDSVTEDLRASLLLVADGYRSCYVSRVLADGLGPLDVESYFHQQFRWAHGALEILLRRRPYTRRMRPAQALQYSLGFIYWFTGFAYVAYLILPTMYLFFGMRPVEVPNQYPVYFLPYVLTALSTIVYASDYSIRFDALSFTLASFPVHIRALLAAIFGRTVRFVVTPKSEHDAGGTFKPVHPQLVAIAILAVACMYGLVTTGPLPSTVNNVAWSIAHILVLQGLVVVSRWPKRRVEGVTP